MRADFDPVLPRVGLIEIDELAHELVEIRLDQRELAGPRELQKGVQDLFQVPAFRLDGLEPGQSRRSRGDSGALRSSAISSNSMPIVESGLRISWAKPPAKAATSS